MSPLRIVRIVARLNIGGPAVHILQLSAAHSAERFESQVITGLPGQDEGDMGYLAEQLEVKTVVVPSLGRELSPFRDMATIVRLTRLLRQLQPDIVETHTAKAGAVGRVAARLAAVPAIVHVFHGHVFHSYFGPWKSALFRRIERLLARFCTDRVVVISQSQRRDIVDEFRIAPDHKVSVIPLGFNLQRFVDATPDPSVRKQLGADSSQLLVGLVGRLTLIKNPRLLLQAASLVRRQSANVRFAFIGDGELRAELEQAVEAEGLGDCVVFAGWRKDMPTVCAALDLVALTSNNEGTPVSLIEAMAAGTPAVATDVGGVSDVVTDQATGLLTKAGDAEQLASAILRLESDAEERRRMGEQGQREMLERFRLERLVHDFEELYESLAKKDG